ncbi:hypothetical protein ACHAXR_004773 [Thalassiosira sp. AJA248-18]
MSAPATCIATAATTSARRPGAAVASFAALAGKRALSVGTTTTVSQSSSSSSSACCAPSTTNSQSYGPSMVGVMAHNRSQSSPTNHHSLPLMGLEQQQRRNYTSMPSSSGQQQQRPLLHSIKTTLDNTPTTARAFSSASKRDFYDVLSVGKGADKGEIKKAYFKLAKKYHPDTNKDDKTAADKFKEATEAYEVLSDQKSRELYDTYGHAGVDPNAGFGQGGGGGNPFEGFQGFSGFSGGDGSFHFSSSSNQQEIDPEELFEAFFGGGTGRRRNRGPRKGADLQMHVRLTFQEAVQGVKKDLHLRYQIHNKKSNRMEVKERDVTVDVPAGIDNGMNLRLSEQGAEGDPGAPRGNLIVQVLVDNDEYFHRDGMDVHTECPISLSQAILGGTVDVRTLTGIVEMKIPKGTQIESKLMLRGKGIPHLNYEGRRGNQIVHLKIEIPKKVSKRQEELLREFDEEMKHSGGGIYGRLAKAAGSAFETIFGQHGEDDAKKEEKKKSQDNMGKKTEKGDDSSKDDDSDDDVDEKKQQTA